MGSPVDLTLGRSTQAPRKNNGRNLGALRKVEVYLRALQDERRKIEGFKRELPLCMQLLEDAIEISKEELAVESGDDAALPLIRPLQLRCGISMDTERESNAATAAAESAATQSSGRPVLEEFMPLKRPRPPGGYDGIDGEGEREREPSVDRPRGTCCGRPAWMVEAQLWTQTPESEPPQSHREKDAGDDLRRRSEFEPPEQEPQSSSVTSSQLLFTSKQRPAGAFLPFIRERPAATAPLLSGSTAGTGSGDATDLSLGGADSEVGSIDGSFQTPEQGPGDPICKDTGIASNGAGSTTSAGGSQSQRKARRCWSPELHRRFVSALHQLGGSQVATPKQIRELMKVDGLTNDEVKSHLQKYRLHTRRPSPSPQSAAQQPPQLVVLGGIWVPPEYAAAAAGGGQPSAGVYDPSIGRPAHNPLYCQPSLPQEYFAHLSNGGGPLQIQRQPFFEPQQAASQSQSSPQGGPLQVRSQLSGGTRDLHHDDSGGEEGDKGDSPRSWKAGRPSGQDVAEGPTSGSENFAEPNKRAGLKLQMPCGAPRSHVTMLDKEAQRVA